MKRRFIIKGILFTILLLVFSGSSFNESNNFLLTFIRLINAGLLSFMLVNIFSNIVANHNTENRKLSKRLIIINLLWGITFLIANFIEYGFNFKVINILGIFVILLSCYELFIRKENLDNRDSKDINMYKFGYLLLICVLLILALLIFVLKGY